MSNDEFERFLERHARDYNPPPEPPREEMWAEIRHRLPRKDQGGGDALSRQRRKRAGRLRWAPLVGIGIAATLALGFGLGRITGVSPAGSGGPGAPVASRVAVDAGVTPSVRLAAAGHLGEAEAMLTFYRTAEQDADRAATAEWARELLSTTRLLLDSRAGEDAVLAALLVDLELVLVQIAASGGDPEERGLVEDGIERSQLLPKLRTASGGDMMAL